MVTLNNSKFVYIIYIRTTPERIWDSITKPELTRQYWGYENISEWKLGYDWQHVFADNKRKLKQIGEVIKVIPRKLLRLSWVDPHNLNDSSQVTFEIESINGIRLKVTHNNFKSGSKMFEQIKDRWPKVLFSMKSFLENGKPLITWN